MFNVEVPCFALSEPVALVMMPSLTVPLYSSESVKVESGSGPGNKTVSPCTRKADITFAVDGRVVVPYNDSVWTSDHPSPDPIFRYVIPRRECCYKSIMTTKTERCTCNVEDRGDCS